MKVNIENCLNQATTKADGFYKYSVQEFIQNLKLLKAGHDAGKSQETLDEFFGIYVFNQEKTN